MDVAVAEGVCHQFTHLNITYNTLPLPQLDPILKVTPRTLTTPSLHENHCHQYYTPSPICSTLMFPFWAKLLWLFVCFTGTAVSSLILRIFAKEFSVKWIPLGYGAGPIGLFVSLAFGEISCIAAE